MEVPQVKYLKALYGSNANLVFIGAMLFLSLVISPAMLFFLVAGQLGLLMAGQIGFVQKMLQAGFQREAKLAQQQKENQLAMALPASYQSDFQSLKGLCQEIERRASEQQADKTAMLTVGGLIEKLENFRFEYVQMLRAHSMLANRNYKQLQSAVEKEIKKAEQSLCNEESGQVRVAIEQNLKILRQRLNKTKQLEDLVRLIEARLQVVRNSLQLVQDELYSMTSVRGISEMVDSLLVNMELSDEFRSSYNELLAGESAALSGLDMAATGQGNFNTELDNGPKPQPNKLQY
jgi:hypothetical protein